MILFGNYQLAPCNIWSDENCSEYSIYPECYSHPCISISEFASNLSDYLHPCTHLILQSGNHTLNSPFVFAHIETLSLSTNFSSTTIVCVNQSITIGFEHVSNVHIDGVTFITCKTFVNSSKNFTLENSSYFGMNMTGTALFSVNTTAYLSNCSFTQFHGTQFTNAIIGGAIIISRSTFHMYECILEENGAHRGGALFLGQNSSLLLLYCMINDNHDHPSPLRNILTRGGAILVCHGCHITVTNSTFTNNTAIQGGVLYLEGLFITVDVMLSNNTFSQNSGQYGGVFYARFQNINVYNSYFINNTARYYGGVFYSYKANIRIDRSNFVNSTARSRGGVLYATDTNASMDTSVFTHNTANRGGVFLCF